MNRCAIQPMLLLALAFAVQPLNATEQSVPQKIDELFQLKDQPFQTSTLFSAKSITRHGNTCPIAVYKGNAYTVYAREGDERMIVAKVPLDGSAVVTMPLVNGTVGGPGYKAVNDNHRHNVIAVDRSGYIHVCGFMHSTPIIYWRSEKPEDISSFKRIMPDDSLPKGKQPCPIAGSITFPLFFSDRHGQLFWTCVQGCGPLCSYDETTKLWTALGRELGTMAKSAKERDYISFYYEDNKSYSTPDPDRVKGGLTQRGFHVVCDSKNRMHMAIGLLNRDKHGEGAHTGNATDILYAYSDDGGKTVFKSDGKQIQLPIRAEAGPNQGEVIFNENGALISCHARIGLDNAERPMISCHSYKTGDHCFLLESGHWVPCPAALVGREVTIPPSNVMIDKEDYDRAYYINTGELVWTSLSGGKESFTFTVHRTVFNGDKK